MRVGAMAMLLLGALTCLGCGWSPSVGKTGSDVGGACGSDISCDETCVTGSPFFPGGVCTWRCNADTDCPIKSICSRIVLANSGGYHVCVNTCQSANDCRTGYQCADVPKADGGTAAVCWVPGTIGQ